MKQKEESLSLLRGTAGDGAPASRPGLVRVLASETLSPPPLWLMRQAGRYLPEYRTVRATAGSFLDLCFDPELAAEVTLQPIRRFGFDAAILFSDILVVPHALGRSVRFVEGGGPRLDPIDAAGIDALRYQPEHLSPVLETVARVRAELDPGRALIGFAGAPWTVATYMVAGRGTADQAPARIMAARQPEPFQDLIDRIAGATADYLVAQLRAGADVVQIFDSWAGVLSEVDFDRYAIAPARRIVDAVRQRVPGAKVIGFPKAAGLRLERYVRGTGIDAVGIDWTTPFDYARERLQPVAAVQGNLDPIVLLAGGSALDASVDAILSGLSGGRFIFNLGHGILPETPVGHVERVVARVREGSR